MHVCLVACQILHVKKKQIQIHQATVVKKKRTSVLQPLTPVFHIYQLDVERTIQGARIVDSIGSNSCVPSVVSPELKYSVRRIGKLPKSALRTRV